MSYTEEKVLFSILDDNSGESPIVLMDVIRELRKRCGGFTEVEAVVHMMDALVAEATDRRGW